MGWKTESQMGLVRRPSSASGALSFCLWQEREGKVGLQYMHIQSGEKPLDLSV